MVCAYTIRIKCIERNVHISWSLIYYSLFTTIRRCLASGLELTCVCEHAKLFLNLSS
jgi:hypothetical protein